VTDLLPLLQEFRTEKLTELLRHQSGARLVAPYDINNTYQYVINREDVQVSWLSTAITGLGGEIPSDPIVPERRAAGRGPAWRAIVEEDALAAQAFVERWRPRVDALGNARQRGMLGVILGETLEQKRFFDQALAGRDDLLGRRDTAAGVRVGEVLSTRWIE
jgi:hypothetical protein